MHNLKIIFYFIIFFSLSQETLSHHKIYGAVVEEGRRSLEWRGHLNLDDDTEVDKEHHHVFESEYSWTNFWQSEIEFHLSDKGNTSLDFEKIEIQNQIQIIDTQNYAAAIYFSYNFISEGDKGDEIEYKFLNQYGNDYFNFITNFIFEKQVGSQASGSTEFSLTNYLVFEKPVYKKLKIGFIGFSEFGKISSIKTYHTQEHQYGIQLENEFILDEKEYEFTVGYLHGLTDESANHSVIWNLELEL